MSTIADLWSAAERAGDGRPALLGGEQVSFAELGGRIRTAADTLVHSLSVRPGDAVAILAPNSAAFVTAYFAAQWVGAIALPLDERLTDEQLADLLSHSGAVGLLAAPSLSGRAAQLTAASVTGVPVQLISESSESGDSRPQPPSAAVSRPQPPSAAFSRLQPAELLYTSGTTGNPKGVLRSHANVLAAVRNARTAFGYRPGDTIAIAMPLSHSSALTSQLLPVLQAGGRAVLLPRFDPSTMLEAIAANGVSCVRLVPAMIRLLLTHDEFRAERLPSLRLILNSSAPVDPESYRELKRRFAQIAVVNSYGLTEASTCTVLPDRLALVHPDSVGMAIEGVGLTVRDDAGDEVPAGEDGEIWIAGPHVFVGYHRDPEATAAARSGEWLRTGDIGRRDAGGLLYLDGRRDDLINCGGRKVAPELVERCLATAPGVRDAACAGMPHRVLGQVVRAFVVPDDPAAFDSRAAVRWCAAHLPSHMVPFELSIVSELPRNSVGKLVRRRLGAVSA